MHRPRRRCLRVKATGRHVNSPLDPLRLSGKFERKGSQSRRGIEGCAKLRKATSMKQRGGRRRDEKEDGEFNTR